MPLRKCLLPALQYPSGHCTFTMLETGTEDLAARLQVPEAVADWVEDMASSWDFQRIIPCHMAAPIQATPNDLRCGLRTAR